MLPGRGSRRCWADGACIPAGAGASVGVLVAARYPRWISAVAGAEVVLDGGPVGSAAASFWPAAAVGRRVMSRGFDASLSGERLVTLVAVLRLALTL